MPPEQPLIGQRRSEVLGGIEHHLDHALDIPVGGLRSPGIKPEASGDGRAHLFGIELLALDLAGLQDVQRQRVKLSLLLQGKAKPLHPAQQPPLAVADLRQRGGKGILVPVKPRPVRTLMYIESHSTHRCES